MFFLDRPALKQGSPIVQHQRDAFGVLGVQFQPSVPVPLVRVHEEQVAVLHID